jgi:hypothetical protein
LTAPEPTRQPPPAHPFPSSTISNNTSPGNQLPKRGRAYTPHPIPRQPTGSTSGPVISGRKTAITLRVLSSRRKRSDPRRRRGSLRMSNI